MGFLDAVGHAFSGAGHFLAAHWKTIAVVTATVAVGVVLTVATGGLLGVPALVALGGGIVGGGGLAAAGAAAVGAFGAGMAGYGLGHWLSGQAGTWKGALLEGGKSVLLTLATLGLAKGLGLLAPYAGEALSPITKPIGEAMAPYVRPAANALAKVTRPVVNTTTKVLDAVNEGGQNVRQGILQAAGREPVVDAQQAAQEWAQAVKEGSPSVRKTPHVSAVVVDGKTGAVYKGTSGDTFEPYPEEIAPELAARLPASPPIAGRPFQNCAEFKAVNKALQAGAKLEDLEPPVAVATKDGYPMSYCENCQSWIPHTHGPAQTEGVTGALSKVGGE